MHAALLPRHSAGQGGLTLIEMMVALAISLALMLGLTTLFSSVSLSFRVNDESARLQENGTAALRYLISDLRNAGFYGIGTSSLSVDPASVAGITINPDCGPLGTALDLSVPLSVTKGLNPGNVHASFPCIDGANFYPGSPVIVVRGATGTAISAPTGGTIDGAGGPLQSQPNYSNTLYVQGSTQDPNTVLFFGSAYHALRLAGRSRALKDGTDAPAFEYQTHVYYIRPCSRPSGAAGTRCTVSDDGGAPIPTLVRQELAGSALQEVALVEGIEALALSYGIDNADALGNPYGPGAIPDGIPDQYTSAAPADWGLVTAARISVRVRSLAPVAGQDDSAKRYDLGDGAAPYQCADNDCRYLRQIYAQSAQLRNCAMRRQGGGLC